jgi:hypothetical protein
VDALCQILLGDSHFMDLLEVWEVLSKGCKGRSKSEAGGGRKM